MTKSDRILRLVPLIVIVLAALPYLGVPGYEFVIVDDPQSVYQNPYIHLPLGAAIARFWRASYSPQYTPITFSAWTLLAQLAVLKQPIQTIGMGRTDLNPAVFHVANLILHLVNVLLVYRLLHYLMSATAARRSVGTDEPEDTESSRRQARTAALAAAAGALLFGVHPLQVESVAWVTGLHSVLSGTFAIAAMDQYLRWSGRRAEIGADQAASPMRYVGATALFVLALLSKPAMVSLPFCVVILDCVLLRRPIGRTLAAMVPWICASGVVAWITRQASAPGGGVRYDYPLWQRPFVIGDAVAFYLGKAALPVRLAFDYGRNSRLVMASWWGFAIWLVPAALAILLWLWQRSAR